MNHSSGHSELRLENLLAAVTDAMLADEADVDRIFERYAISRVDVEDLLALIQRLKTTLVGVRPSRRYVARLKQDLVGQAEQRNVIDRWRTLPPRVQIAAMVALLAGFVLLSRRAAFGRLAAAGDVAEVPAVQ